MSRRNRRLLMISAAGLLLAFGVGLTMFGLRDNVTFFVAPSEMAEKVEIGRKVRIGGLVEAGSVSRQADGVLVFRVTDGAGVVNVRYQGDPPALFGEDQGVVAEGRLQADGSFRAERILARHDEEYMPQEVAEALKKSGRWQGEDTQK